MKHKLRSFVAYLLCLLQCGMLFSSDILAATSEGGDISSSFKIGITSCTIKIIDRYYDDNGNFEYENIRQEDTYDYGDWYDYYALDPVPNGYVYVGDYDRFLYGEADSENGYKEYYTYGEADGDREVIFSYQKEPGCTITVKDKYVDRFGTEIRTDVRCTENKYLGEEYSYDCVSYDENEYTLVSNRYTDDGDLITSQSGTVTGNLEIIFTYQKIAEAYITVSYSEALCDYLNEHNSGGNHTYSPDEEVDKFKVVLGKGYWDNDFEINLEDLRNFSDANISSFRTYYYTDGGWSSDYYYLGFPLDGAVSRDPYLFLTRYDEDYNYSDIFQYCIQFYLNLHFPSDLPVEPDTDVCCHIVLDRNGFNPVETIRLRGVYRTVIEALDADARHDSWYKFKNPNGAGNGINLAIGTYTEVQKNPDKFEFVEDGTVLMRWDDEDEEGEPIYDYDDRVAIRGRDKSNNIIVVNRDGTPYALTFANP